MDESRELESRSAQPVRLLVTKLYIPHTRTELVERPRLVAMLNHAAQRPLAVVCAPAGFGKTTLLSDWARQCGIPVAWLSLDAGDSDPARFWAYAIAALQTVRPGAGEDTLSLLHAPQPPAIESLLTSLINDLAAVAAPFILVLDDYHSISAQAVHDALAFLIEHMPPQMHLMVASRNDPPLPLALLRARSQVIEIGAPDLRFTAGEAAAFLNQVMQLGLPAQDVAALEQHTEGWIAALQLAALSMRGVDDQAAFIKAFTGSHRYMVDYLAQEILNRQTEPVRDFLLRTSVLERLSGPLCDALTGRSDGQARLETLERAHLFVVPIDQERRWYRYHHLFGEFLQARLEQTEPALGPDLHRRASDWYAQHGFVSETIGHAFLTGDNEYSARRIEELGDALFESSELVTLRGWLQRLPSAVVHARPRLTMIYAWVLLATGQADSVEEQLQALEGSPVAGEAGTRGEIAAIRSSIAAGSADFAGAVYHAEEALRCLDSADHVLGNSVVSLRGVAAFNLAIAHELTGNAVAASSAFAEAARLNKAAANIHLAPLCISHLALAQVLRGQLRQAAQTYQQALQSASEMSARPSPLSAVAYAGLGSILCEWNDLEAAEKNLQAGIDLGRPWQNWDALLPGYLGLARVRAAQGDVKTALAMIDRLAGVAPAVVHAFALSFVEAQRAVLALRAGDVEAAAQWQRNSGLACGDAPNFLTEPIYLILARVCIAQGQDVLPLLEQLQQGAEAGGRGGHVIEIRMLRALALQAQAKQALAVRELEQALILAGPEGYVRIFADERQAMARLLAAVTAPALSTMARKLLAAAQETASPLQQKDAGRAVTPVAASALAEPLSAREREVLVLLAQGHSNQLIAQKLVVSQNTVKTHIKNIYEKLAVNSRTLAVSRARDLGLL